MSKKKKSKKHNFKATSTSETSDVTIATQAPILAAPAAATTAEPVDPRWGYVGLDVRRTVTLAVSCVLIEVALSFIFNHSGLGTAVYKLINI